MPQVVNVAGALADAQEYSRVEEAFRLRKWGSTERAEEAEGRLKGKDIVDILTQLARPGAVQSQGDLMM